MKKAIWAAIILLAGGAVIAATAIDKKGSEPEKEAKTQTSAPVTPPEPDAAEPTEKAGTIGAPTIEPVIYGKPDAPVVIEEFASFTCPHCAHFHKDTLPDLEKQFLEKGIAQLHMYSFVRNEQDMRATQLVYCVEGNENRQRFVKALMQSQEQWAFSNDFVGNLRIMAQVGGVGSEQFDKCVADKTVEDKLVRNREYANGLGITSTPFFVIGKDEIKGARDIETFAAAIKDAQESQEKK